MYRKREFLSTCRPGARFLAILIGCTALASCDLPFGSEKCTLIGCSSGLEIVLDAPPSIPYRVEVYVDGQARYVYRCDTPTSCRSAFFSEFTPASVHVEVITADGIQRVHASPQYTVSRPNGEDCEPLCRTAVVRIPAA